MDVLDLRYPFTGRWLVQNSPADRVPSHGTTAFASAFAIDFVPVDDRGRSAPLRLATLIRPEPPERFFGFGAPLLAPIDGVVVAAHDAEVDHPTHRGLPSVGYALTQPRRAARGWLGLAGNHVMIRSDAGPHIVLCHLRRRSLRVDVGDRVLAGEIVGECGNTGNSTEPHVHVQALDRADPTRASAVPISFDGGLPRSGAVLEIEPGGVTG